MYSAGHPFPVVTLFSGVNWKGVQLHSESEVRPQSGKGAQTNSQVVGHEEQSFIYRSHFCSSSGGSHYSGTKSPPLNALHRATKGKAFNSLEWSLIEVSHCSCGEMDSHSKGAKECNTYLVTSAPATIDAQCRPSLPSPG